MTTAQILARIEQIKAADGDPEVQHGIEDSLYCDFVDMIARSGGEYADLARLILTTTTIDFPRWCA